MNLPSYKKGVPNYYLNILQERHLFIIFYTLRRIPGRQVTNDEYPGELR
jgi:hypothetical protein